MNRGILVISGLVLIVASIAGAQSAPPAANGARGAQQGAMQQPAAPPNDAVFTAVQQLVTTMTKNIEAGADEMPADKYNFKPTPAQNTFGHLVVHMIGANYRFCTIMTGGGMYSGTLPKDDDPKDTLLPALKSSFDFCGQKLATLDDAKLESQINMGRGSVALGTILVTFVEDYGDHYAQEAGYLRAAGLVPPTASQPAPAR
jgi:hypothetical protein